MASNLVLKSGMPEDYGQGPLDLINGPELESARDILSTSLLAYGKYIRPVFQAPRHLRLIASKLEAVERGEIKRLILSCPPRHGKSYLGSELFPAWLLGKNPLREIIAVSYAASLAHKFGGRVRAIASSSRHNAVFPSCIVNGRSTSGFDWETDVGGKWLSAGIGGPCTGRGADFILIDDPIKNSQAARSKKVVEGLETYFSETLYTRLLPGGAIVLTMTRWTDFDLVAYVLKEFPHENWEVINLEAICETPEEDPLHRLVGEALWPERYPIETLLNIKATLSDSFYALYQGHPVSAKGSLIKRDMIRYYSPSQSLDIKYMFISMDTASTANTSSDFTAGLVWAVCSDNYLYLIDGLHDKYEFPELLQKAKDFASLWGVTDMVIENASSGIQLIQTLSFETKLNAIKSQAKGDYYSKLSATSAYLTEVFLPMPSPEVEWGNKLVDELVTFPYAQHDDLVVAFIIGVLHWVNNIRGKEPPKMLTTKKSGYLGNRRNNYPALVAQILVPGYEEQKQVLKRGRRRLKLDFEGCLAND